MVFSDTTDYQGLVQDIDFLLFGDGTTFNNDYSIEDRTRNINNAYNSVIADLFKADPNFMWDDTTNVDLPIATTTLVANQTNYQMPDKSLVVIRLRVHDKNGNMKTLEPVQRSELTDAELTETGEPRYYYKIDNAIFLAPVPDYGGAAGMELHFQRSGVYFADDDTTKTPGFASIFHNILSIKAALVYARANGMSEKVSVLKDMEQEIEHDIREHYQRRSPDKPPSLKLKNRSVNSYGL